MDNFNKAQEIVKKYHQEHLLKFYDKLEENKKNQLLEQILKTDFELLNRIYEDVNKEKNTEDVITPISYTDKSKLSEEKNIVPRMDGFDISVASEIMAIFCLASDINDLKRRIGNITTTKLIRENTWTTTIISTTATAVTVLDSSTVIPRATTYSSTT